MIVKLSFRITLLAFLFSSYSFAQNNLSDSVKKLWNTVYGISIDTIKTNPIRENVILDYPSASIILQLYSKPYVIAYDEFKIFYLWTNTSNGITSKVTGKTKLKYWDMNSVSYWTGAAESMINFKGVWYASSGRWEAGDHYQYLFKSTDNGNNFFQLQVAKQRLGEDGSFTIVGDSIYWFIRPYARDPDLTPHRTIGLKKSKDFLTWSNTIEILKPDVTDVSQYKDYYEMNVLQNGNDFWGLLHVYQRGDNGREGGGDYPPYIGDEQTVSVQLFWSSNGTNWIRCSRNNFISRPAGISQQYAQPVINNGVLNMVVSESAFHHAEDNVSNSWKLVLYTISITELNKWKP